MNSCVWSMRLLEIMQLKTEHFLNLLEIMRQFVNETSDGCFSVGVVGIFQSTPNLAFHLLQWRALSSD